VLNTSGLARLILQDDGLFPWLTASANLAIVPNARTLDEMPADLTPLSALVAPYADKVVGTLSFGQRRLLELLRVLANPTPLILLDEPLNFLDASRRRAVLSVIASLSAQRHRFVISSHYELDFDELHAKRFRFEGDMPYHTLRDLQ
jgi:ABC-type multidrug transport system ATPase subunit